MSAGRRPCRRRALALFTLLAACDPVKPTPEPAPTVLEVTPGTIFAAEFEDAEFHWWIVDPNTGSIAQSGTASGGAVQIDLDQAAGAYITTPSTSTAPPYTVELTGSVEEGSVVSYLATDTAAFDGLRASDGVPMADAHADFLATAATLEATFSADLETTKQRMVTQVALAAIAAQDTGWDCAAPLHDAVDLDDIRAGTAGLPPWVADVEDLALDLEEEVLADEAVAQGNALEFSALIPDETQLETEVEACLDLETLADDVDDTIDRWIPKAIADENWTYDGRREDSGELTDKEWIAFDDALDKASDQLEEQAWDMEQCVEEAVGGEPTVIWDDISPDPYEDLGAAAELIAADRELEAGDCELAVAAAFGLWIDQDELTGDLDPALFYEAHTNAWPLVLSIGGADLLDESTGTTTTPSTATPSTATSRTADPMAADRMPIDNSSADACENTTPVFQFNVLGMGVAIGTPFNDVIRGADNDSGFEVLVGGKGDDCINSRKGHELVFGGKGDDELHGGDQHELIFGGPGDDEIFLGEGESYSFTIPATPPIEVDVDLGSLAFGGKGADWISGSDPDFDPADTSDFGFLDVIFGDGLTDHQAGGDHIEGGGGIDLLFGQWQDDTIENHRPGVIELEIGATVETPATSLDLEMGSFFFGGKGSDTFQGSPSFDLLFGNTGDDGGGAGAGFDLVFGSTGNDSLDGEDGVDLLFGSGGDDVLTGGEGIDLVVGGGGNDDLDGGPGPFDLVFAGRGDDTARGGAGLDLVTGGVGSDVVEGGPGLDLVFGGDGPDTVRGNDGIDLLFGSTGRDRVEGGAGAVDLLFGGDDVDIVEGQDGMDVIFSGEGDDWVHGGEGFDLAWSAAGQDGVFGGNGLDVLFGGEEGDCMWGEGGVDITFGGEGTDLISGGPELDLIVGGEGADQLYGDGGTDLILGGDDADELHGGDGVDLLFGGGAADSLLGDQSLDLLFAGDGDDCLQGDDGFDIGFGGSGADEGTTLSVAFGGDGDDALSVGRFGTGSDGNDVVRTGEGVGALLLGGAGEDHLYVATAAGTSFVFAGKGDDTLTAPGATPTSDPAIRTFLFGNADSDWIQASKGKSRAFGNKGDDTMAGDADGSSTNDDLRDWLFGGKDSDALYGDSSSKRDLMIRGGGNDPSRTWDGLPSTSPGWSSAHAEPTLGTCPVSAPLDCDGHKEPPADVGAEG